MSESTTTKSTNSNSMHVPASGEIKKTVMYKWNEVMTRKMVNLFREEPSLWDSRIRKYRNTNRLTRNDAWVRIANALGIDRDECERKMNSLLAQYRRERIKMKRAKEGEIFEHHKLWPGYLWFDFLAELDAERAQVRSLKRHKREPLKLKQEVSDLVDLDQLSAQLFLSGKSNNESNGDISKETDETSENDHAPMDMDELNNNYYGSGENDESQEDEEDDDNYNPLFPEVIVEEMNGPDESYTSPAKSEEEKKKLTIPKPIIRETKHGSSISVRTLRRILPKPVDGDTSCPLASTSSSSIVNGSTMSSSLTVSAPKLTASSSFFLRGGKLDGSPIVTSVPVKGTPTVFLRHILPKPQQVKQEAITSPQKPTVRKFNLPPSLTPGPQSSKRDNIDIFGEYISTKMRLIDERIRPLLQFEINRLIFEAETGTGKFQDPIAVALSSVGIVEETQTSG